MLILSKVNVFDQSLERIRYLFDEFEEVTVQHSGGKDSTIIFNLAMIVAKEKNRLPLNVFFIDQEAEWTQTIDSIKEVMYHPDVTPYWYQMPMHIDNATSFIQNFLYCWEDGGDWLRDKDPLSIKENTYDEVKWDNIFQAIIKKDFAGKRHCTLTGVRAEESPRRRMALTQGITYKFITWGNKKGGDNHFAFHPIYDWSYTDVWKAIHDHNWSYCKIYDLMYQYGVSVHNMRVSNLHHETAVRSLFYLQEFDPALYDKLAHRLQGVDTAGKMNADDFFAKKLPFMFKSWEEYCYHLIDKLVDNERWEKSLVSFLKMNKEVFDDDPKMYERASKVGCQSVLANDTACTKLKNFSATNTSKRKKDKRRIAEGK
jgi:predicted phosphoadenosine phosphosulfate sulfurtransferase